MYVAVLNTGFDNIVLVTIFSYRGTDVQSLFMFVKDSI